MYKALHTTTQVCLVSVLSIPATYERSSMPPFLSHISETADNGMVVL